MCTRTSTRKPNQLSPVGLSNSDLGLKCQIRPRPIYHGFGCHAFPTFSAIMHGHMQLHCATPSLACSAMVIASGFGQINSHCLYPSELEKAYIKSKCLTISIWVGNWNMPMIRHASSSRTQEEAREIELSTTGNIDPM
uniref:Uncharacterized protein n=1 Tax=Nelumbo nucifera TaxID=4432 RepID=A0A822YSK7_NELNU|nr:TPA_asm: hypothetical protein HUJ06_006272 [Nelumbo nucifera]